MFQVSNIFNHWKYKHKYKFSFKTESTHQLIGSELSGSSHWESSDGKVHKEDYNSPSELVLSRFYTGKIYLSVSVHFIGKVGDNDEKVGEY